ncbi:MAG TPA: SMP-30/gluconolactonase/LRE family protein [Pseudonocardiaceae bacterium]|nr:SMP-30/gluconolactonase/LRE family protein [Pseudonocardiaceae bacterium]
MRRAAVWRAATVLAAVVATTGVLVGWAGSSGAATHPASLTQIGANATWTTIFKGTKAGIEGLTGDDHGNVYVAERGGGSDPCPVWKIAVASHATTQVGFVPGPCSPSGLAFGPDGRLYITGADAPAQDQIDVLTPGDATTAATVFATGVAQANGIAFDGHGNLWATDGNNKQGIVYRVGPAGGAAAEVFRVPSMANSIGVGRQNGTLQGTTPNTANPQDIVANGIVFTGDGEIVVADTARGALWKVRLDSQGNVASPTGCDQTYPADTLCLDDVFVEHPAMEGADGIALDSAGRVWVDANERQAIVVVGQTGAVTEFFRNPVDPTTGRRDNGPLETPTSPVFLGRTLCTTSSDGNRRDNFPNSGGEVTNTGKISCLDQRLDVPGLNLPVR